MCSLLPILQGLHIIRVGKLLRSLLSVRSRTEGRRSPLLGDWLRFLSLLLLDSFSPGYGTYLPILTSSKVFLLSGIISGQFIGLITTRLLYARY